MKQPANTIPTWKEINKNTHLELDWYIVLFEEVSTSESRDLDPMLTSSTGPPGGSPRRFIEKVWYFNDDVKFNPKADYKFKATHYMFEQELIELLNDPL